MTVPMLNITIQAICQAFYYVILLMLTITASDITLQTSRCAHLAFLSATEYRHWMFSLFIAPEYSHLVEMILVTMHEAEHAHRHCH